MPSHNTLSFLSSTRSEGAYSTTWCSVWFKSSPLATTRTYLGTLRTCAPRASTDTSGLPISNVCLKSLEAPCKWSFGDLQESLILKKSLFQTMNRLRTIKPCFRRMRWQRKSTENKIAHLWHLLELQVTIRLKLVPAHSSLWVCWISSLLSTSSPQEWY